MRSAIIAAAFALGALAVPYEKRAVVTNTQIDVVYATNYVTVTAGSQPVTSPRRHRHRIHRTSTVQAVTTKTTTSVAKAPTSSAKQTTTPITTSVVKAPTSTAKQTPTTTAATAQPTVGAPSTGSYSDIAVYHHNLHRQNHTSPAIAWDASLAQSAADIAATCVYAHNTQMDGGGYGQNIAAGVQADNISAIITDMFYNGEVNYYNGLYGQAQPSMTNFEHWGHFSQIVWYATTHVGCATQDCSAQGLANTGGNVPPYFTVCNYKSPGNYANQYGANVLQPIGNPTAHWNTGLS